MSYTSNHFLSDIKKKKRKSLNIMDFSKDKRHLILFAMPSHFSNIDIYTSKIGVNDK